ncbi:MAG: 30S ribosomal protein S8 [Patescibacteria group bacterium]
MMTDPIADMLTRIRNATMVKQKTVCLPFSKIKFIIGKMLEREGYLTKVERKEASSWSEELELELRYDTEKKPVIRGLRRISKPGLRVYIQKDEIPTVMSGFGIAILSTSQGLMTNKEAKMAGLGGELICEIW